MHTDWHNKHCQNFHDVFATYKIFDDLNIFLPFNKVNPNLVPNCTQNSKTMLQKA